MRKLTNKLALNSLNAVLSALEIYNKPDCKYRDEGFSILIVNAYELLFKAKILLINKENIKSLYIYENRKNKNGTNSKQRIIKKNRLDQPYTLDLNSCISILKNKGLITNNIKENIDILIEIRDNAIHLLNNKDIKYKLYSVCAASIKNYAKLLEKWFPKISLKKYNFFITPLNFDVITNSYESANLNLAQKNFLNYIDIAEGTSSMDDEYDLLLKVDVKFIRNNNDDGVLIKYVSEGKKINVELSEEMFKKMYPYNFHQIVEKIKNERQNIKINRDYYKINKQLQGGEICCKARYLDFNNKNGVKKFYYNSGFVGKFLEKYDETYCINIDVKK